VKKKIQRVGELESGNAVNQGGETIGKEWDGQQWKQKWLRLTPIPLKGNRGKKEYDGLFPGLQKGKRESRSCQKKMSETGAQGICSGEGITKQEDPRRKKRVRNISHGRDQVCSRSNASQT